MTQRRKVESLDVPDVPINFLLSVSDRALGDYELKVLTDVANARDEVIEALERFSLAQGRAGIVRWFRTIDREGLKRKILNPDDVLELAKQQIKDGQKSEEELVEELLPRPLLPPGSAHLAAALRYQKRNLEEGKCISCPEPLAPNSKTFCERHLREKRVRYKPKNARGSKPGSIGWLHGEGFESQHGRQPGTLAALALGKEKQARRALAELGLPLGSAGTVLQAAQEKLLEHVPQPENDGPENEAITARELFKKAGLSEMESTAKHALQQLFSAGLVQRTIREGRNKPLRYFIASVPRHTQAGNKNKRKNEALLDILAGEKP